MVAGKRDAMISRRTLLLVSSHLELLQTFHVPLTWTPIASKYKEYTFLRSLPSKDLSKTAPTGGLTPSASRKRKPEDPFLVTPSKRSRQALTKTNEASTPRKQISTSTSDLYDSPSAVRKLFTPPVLRTSIGPTPQKNGHVLGLFDYLTPPELTRSISVTPQKSSSELSNNCAPLSARKVLPNYVTPSKSHASFTHHGGTQSVSKLDFTTPEFLRRAPAPHHRKSSEAHMEDIRQDGTEDTISNSPVLACMPAKPPVRGLSSMLAKLRQMEEEALDEDLDVLREIEADGKDANSVREGKKMESLVKHSQVELPLGADGVGTDGKEEVSDDSDISREGLGRDGKPLMVWKKRGQKRTTKRVNMRPVRQKLPRQLQGLPTDEDVARGLVVSASCVPQASESSESSDIPGPRGSKSQPTSPACDTEYPLTANQRAYAERDKKPGKAKSGGIVKKVLRKVNAQAHTNFRRLKLRNKGSRGQGGGSKFGGRGRRR